MAVFIKIDSLCTSLSVVLINISMTVIKNVPLPLYFYKTSMVISHRHQFILFFSSHVSDIAVTYNHTSECEAIHRLLTDSITKLVGIHGRIYQIIFFIYLSDRRAFKIFVFVKGGSCPISQTWYHYRWTFLYCKHILL